MEQITVTSERNSFSQFEYDGWQRVADRYESAWSGLTKLFIPHLLEATNVVPGSSVLDVACGPGYVAEAAHVLGASPAGKLTAASQRTRSYHS